jgi:hypothetical protein
LYLSPSITTIYFVLYFHKCSKREFCCNTLAIDDIEKLTTLHQMQQVISNEHWLTLLIDNKAEQAKFMDGKYKELTLLIRRNEYRSILELLDSIVTTTTGKEQELIEKLRFEIKRKCIEMVGNCYESISREQLEMLLPTGDVNQLQISDYFYPSIVKIDQHSRPSLHSITDLSIILTLNKA